mmetsp:Transcript_5904/g.12105  ORF Transcript_5904/g.12105 Transcript_5904/m.12105 type:complete len:207 (-) Transcript_5904:805-1425(-)
MDRNTDSSSACRLSVPSSSSPTRRVKSTEAMDSFDSSSSRTSARNPCTYLVLCNDNIFDTTLPALVIANEIDLSPNEKARVSLLILRLTACRTRPIRFSRGKELEGSARSVSMEQSSQSKGSKVIVASLYSGVRKTKGSTVGWVCSSLSNDKYRNTKTCNNREGRAVLVLATDSWLRGRISLSTTNLARRSKLATVCATSSRGFVV